MLGGRPGLAMGLKQQAGAASISTLIFLLVNFEIS